MARAFIRASSQYIETDSAPAVNIPPFTMACWFNMANSGSQQTIMFSGYRLGASSYFAMFADGQIGGDPIAFWANDGLGFQIARTTTGYTNGTWHHGCAVAIATDDRAIYIDGGSKGINTNSKTVNMPNPRLSIGRFGINVPTTYLDGDVAEPAIWDVALTEPEIAILAAGYSPLLVRPQSLLHYWPLIGRTSPEIDLIGGYDLALGNAPVVADHSPIIYPGNQIVVPNTQVIAGSIMGQLQRSNLGADLFDGVLQ